MWGLDLVFSLITVIRGESNVSIHLCDTLGLNAPID